MTNLLDFLLLSCQSLACMLNVIMQYAVWRHTVGGAPIRGSKKMAGVNVGACHLRYLRLSKSKWNLISAQRYLHRHRGCLTAHHSFPRDNSTAHAPSTWQLLGVGRVRSYSTASVAVKEAISLSPAVKYLVDTNNISDLSLIKPSGPKDRILKG